MAGGAAGKLVNRLEVLLAAAAIVAFFLPWMANATASLSGLELVSLARGRQAEQAEAILLVAFAAIPVLALVTLGAALLGHGVRLFGGLCGLIALTGAGLLWLARRDVDPASGGMVPAYGLYATMAFGLGLLLAAFGLLRLPERRPSPGSVRARR